MESQLLEQIILFMYGIKKNKFIPLDTNLSIQEQAIFLTVFNGRKISMDRIFFSSKLFNMV